MCITSFIFTHVLILRILIQDELFISSFCSSGTCIPQEILNLPIDGKLAEASYVAAMNVLLSPDWRQEGRQVASHLPQSEQEQGRKFDKLPQFSSSATTCVCAFLVPNLRWFEVAFLELNNYLITILNNLSSCTLMLLLLSKKDKMSLK